MKEHNDRELVETVDGARVSSWLPATEAAACARGQHAARASPSVAASSTQQPQTLRERELLRAEAVAGQLAHGKQNAVLNKETEKANATPQV